MAETAVMSMISSVKDVVVGRAMKLMGDPRVGKVMSDPRLMSAAMTAMNVGGAVKGSVDKATTVAAGALGWASQQEVADLRNTIQTLQDTVSSLEARAAAAEARAAEAEAKLAGNGAGKPGAKKS